MVITEKSISMARVFRKDTKLAPNGKPSNLTPAQYAMVRTPEFKAWFGDWENDPENASKVVDENGEPLVVYHGTTKDFYIFDSKYATKQTKVDWGYLGYFFSPSSSLALDFTRINWSKNKSKIRNGSRVLECFLNIRNPQIVGAKKFTMMNESGKKYRIQSIDENYDGWVIEKFSKEERESWERIFSDGSSKEFHLNQYVAFYSNQIKLADGTNTTFDVNTDDIRFADGGSTLLAPNGKPSNLTPEQWKLVRTPEFKAWFGDWENDPENASKVVDENGEPLVVYHFSDIEFNVFEVKGLSDGFFFTKNIEDEEFSQKGWLKSQGLTHQQAKEKGYNLKYEKGKPYFLNIKQFYTKSDVKKSSWSTPYFENVVIEFAKRNKKNDGVEFLREIDNKQIIVAFEPHQIKLADGTNTTFDVNTDDIRFADGGNTLLAPNGKPSNLTPAQHAMVRTPEFKAWFGDWETSPENASKVVDENGEPMVLWHFAKRLQSENERFNVFRVDRQIGSHFGSINQVKNLKYYNNARDLRKPNIDKKDSDYRFFQVFLNIKNPLRMKDEGIFEPATLANSLDSIEKLKVYQWEHITNYTHQSKDSILDRIKYIANTDRGYDGVTYLNRYEATDDTTQINKLDDASDKVFKSKFPDAEYSWIAFYPNQIKLADGTNTTFDANTDDIRFADGGAVALSRTEKNEIYDKWAQLVNMSYTELNDFYNSTEGKEAGLSASEANKLGIHNGRQSASWILKMKKTPRNEWTKKMWYWAKRQIAFISRMSANKGDLYNEKGEKTRKHTSLLIWGHNPEKLKQGGNVVTYKNKFNKKYGFDENESHSLEEISKITKIKLSSLQDIYNKGIGAYKTNPESVRPNVKSKEQWAMARVYSAVMGGKASQVDKNELIEGKMDEGGAVNKTSLLAPNGKPSNLTPEQWHLVRTPEFKAWFGDWENEPETASRAVDFIDLNDLDKSFTNEPLIVYHGTNKGFNEFNKNLIGQHEEGWFGKGFYFGINETQVKRYGNIIKTCFLKIKKPFYFEGHQIDFAKKFDLDYNEPDFANKINEILKKQGFDGLVIDGIWGREFIVFEPNQIKLADGTNTTFDANTDDIRFADGGNVPTENAFEKIIEVAKPYQKELSEQWQKRMIADGETINQYDIELYEYSLVVDLVKAIGNYLLKTDKIETIDLSKQKGVITILCSGTRDENNFYLNTQMIVAGGHNVQRAHFRYLVDTNLTKHKITDDTDKYIQKQKGLTKLQKLQQSILMEQKQLEKANEKLSQAIENSKLSDKEVEKITRQTHKDTYRNIDTTWQEVVLRKADVNYDFDEQKFILSQQEYKQFIINNWKNFNAHITIRENDVKGIEKRINKLQKTVDEITKTFADGGNVPTELLVKLDFYQIRIHTNTDTEVIDDTNDYDEAIELFNNAEPDSSEQGNYNRYSDTYEVGVTLEKQTKTYKWVGNEQVDEFATAADIEAEYPIADNDDNESLYQEIDETEWETIEGKSVETYYGKEIRETKERTFELRANIEQYVKSIAAEHKYAAFLGSTFYALVPHADGYIQVRVSDHFFKQDYVSLGKGIVWDSIESRPDLNEYRNIYAFISINIFDEEEDDKRGFRRLYREWKQDNPEMKLLVDFIDIYTYNSDDAMIEYWQQELNEKIDEMRHDIDDALAANKYDDENFANGGLIKTDKEAKNEAIKVFEKQLEQKHGIELDLYIHANYTDKAEYDLVLSKIIVPKQQREKGVGTKAMFDIIAFADKNNLRIILTPDTSFGGTSTNRLKQFYKQFDFVENKARNKDYSIRESMYRMPQNTTYEQGGNVYYHGSNKYFNTFDLSKIKKGHGVIDYGWGVYITESPEVAHFYAAHTGAKKGKKYIYNVDLNNVDCKEINWINWHEQITPSQIAAIKKQAQTEKNMLVEMLTEPHNTKDMLGRYLYENLVKLLGTDKAASLFLLRAGFCGIKYPVNYKINSKFTNADDKFNYVVFDDELLKVMNVELLNFAKGGNVYASVGIEGNLVGKSRNPYIGKEREMPCHNANMRCFVSEGNNDYRFVYTINNKNVAVLHIDKNYGYYMVRNAYTLPQHRRNGYAKQLYAEATKHLGNLPFSSNLSSDGAALKAALYSAGGTVPNFITQLAQVEQKLNALSSQKINELYAQIPPTTEEEIYLTQHGASRQDIGESALHKNKGNNSDKTWRKLVDRQAQKDAETIEKRNLLRSEYNKQIAEGKLRTPTRYEKLISTANGHEDNASTHAARNVLSKTQVDWEKGLTPTQIIAHAYVQAHNNNVQAQWVKNIANEINNTMTKQTTKNGIITCANCGWSWHEKDTQPHDKYVCHKCNFDNTELQKGIATEQEHSGTLNDLRQRKITVTQAIKRTAVDHLKENPNYYTELEKVENKDKMQAGGRVMSLNQSRELKELLNNLIEKEKKEGETKRSGNTYKRFYEELSAATDKKEIAEITYEMDVFLNKKDKYIDTRKSDVMQIRMLLNAMMLSKRKTIYEKYNVKVLYEWLFTFVMDRKKSLGLSKNFRAKPLNKVEKEINTIIGYFENVIETIAFPEKLGLKNGYEVNTMRQAVSAALIQLRENLKQTQFPQYADIYIPRFKRIIKGVLGVKTLAEGGSVGEKSSSKVKFNEINDLDEISVPKEGNVYTGKTDDKEGGIIVGKRHSECDEDGCGEKFKVQSTGQVIEVEGGEIAMCADSMQAGDTYEFEGKKWTPKQIASYLNVKGGGVKFANTEQHEAAGSSNIKAHGGEVPQKVLTHFKGGEHVITVKGSQSKEKYNFNGTELTPREILSQLNANYGGKEF